MDVACQAKLRYLDYKALYLLLPQLALLEELESVSCASNNIPKRLFEQIPAVFLWELKQKTVQQFHFYEQLVLYY